MKNKVFADDGQGGQGALVQFPDFPHRDGENQPKNYRCTIDSTPSCMYLKRLKTRRSGARFPSFQGHKTLCSQLSCLPHSEINPQLRQGERGRDNIAYKTKLLSNTREGRGTSLAHTDRSSLTLGAGQISIFRCLGISPFLHDIKPTDHTHVRPRVCPPRAHAGPRLLRLSLLSKAESGGGIHRAGLSLRCTTRAPP